MEFQWSDRLREYKIRRKHHDQCMKMKEVKCSSAARGFRWRVRGWSN
jgi:hypothetical protein